MVDIFFCEEWVTEVALYQFFRFFWGRFRGLFFLWSGILPWFSFSVVEAWLDWTLTGSCLGLAPKYCSRYWSVLSIPSPIFMASSCTDVSGEAESEANVIAWSGGIVRSMFIISSIISTLKVFVSRRTSSSLLLCWGNGSVRCLASFLLLLLPRGASYQLSLHPWCSTMLQDHLCFFVFVGLIDPVNPLGFWMDWPPDSDLRQDLVSPYLSLSRCLLLW